MAENITERTLKAPDLVMLRELIRESNVASELAQEAKNKLSIHLVTIMKCAGVEGTITNVNTDTGEIIVALPANVTPISEGGESA